MAGSVVLERLDESGVSVFEFAEVSGGLGLCFFKIVLRLWLKELPAICCQSDVGGSCTRVDRPESNKTGASEDAPRTATIRQNAQKHAVLLGRVEGSSSACQSRSLICSDRRRLSSRGSIRQFMKGDAFCGKCPRTR